jgi:hypothetical protein
MEFTPLTIVHLSNVSAAMNPVMRRAAQTEALTLNKDFVCIQMVSFRFKF